MAKKAKTHVAKPLEVSEADIAQRVKRSLNTELPVAAPEVVPKKSPLHLFLWAKTHKKRAIPGALLFILVIITVVPTTRYLIPGLLFKKDLSFVIQDPGGESRISSADVQIDGKLFTSDQNGIVKATGIRPGSKTVIITKLFYKPFSQKISVSLFTNKQFMFGFVSTGRPAKVTVKNRLSGRMLAGVSVKTEQGSQAKTGSDGTATLVLPSDKSEVKGTISGADIVTADITIRAVQDNSTNVYPATPTGRIYFLSKAGGTVDVVKTNLDGTDRQTVLAGTGKEDDGDTILLASKDWKYLVLKSRRDSTLAKLYLIETATDKVTTMDEGDVNFSLVGWSDSSFIYTVDRNGVNVWQPKRQALKSYAAATKQLTTLDESRAAGTDYNSYAYESIQSIFILDAQIVYVKTWTASFYYGTHLADKKMAIIGIKADGSSKKTLHDWPAGYYTYISSTYSGPSEIYYKVTLDGGLNSNWEYENGTVSLATDLTPDDLTQSYPTYLESPNGNNTFWSEARDGKNVLFIGDKDGKNSKEIATLSEYDVYGWFTNDYVLVSKDGSELYIMGRDGIKPGHVPTKISDYHKPNYNFVGYGKGYGGI